MVAQLAAETRLNTAKAAEGAANTNKTRSMRPQALKTATQKGGKWRQMRVYFSGSTRGRRRRCKQQWGRRGKGREGAHGTAHLHGVAEVERVSDDIWLAASTSRELRVARRRLAEFRTVKRNVLRCFGRSGTCTDDSLCVHSMIATTVVITNCGSILLLFTTLNVLVSCVLLPSLAYISHCTCMMIVFIINCFTIGHFFIVHFSIRTHLFPNPFHRNIHAQTAFTSN